MSDLRGRSVLVTRPAEQAGELSAALREAGALPVLVPAIEIRFLDPETWRARLAQLPGRSWVLLTSTNGVEALRRAGADLSRLRLAAVGGTTAGALRALGADVELVASDQSAAALADELPEPEGADILLVQGSRSGPALRARLEARGARVESLVAYETALRDPAVIASELADRSFDWVTFSSGSAAKALAALPDESLARLRGCHAACIGRSTAEVAEAAGFRVAAIAAQPSAAALVDAMRQN